MRRKKSFERFRCLWKNGICYYGAILIAVKVLVVAVIISGCTKDETDQLTLTDQFSNAGIEDVFPSNQAESVEVNPVVGVTFRQGTDPLQVSSASLSLKKGNSSVSGSVSSAGTSVVFTTNENLSPMAEYTATLTTVKKNGAGNYEPVDLSWKFKTGKDLKDKSLTVISVDPANLSTNVSPSASVIVKVNKEIKTWMKSFISLDLVTGTEHIQGSVSFDKSTITFKPSSPFKSNALITGNFSFGQRNNEDEYDDDVNDDDDEEGESQNLNNSFTWSFTTSGSGPVVPVTLPAVASVVPANNSVSVVISTVLSATFSTAMDPATITSSTFILKKGTVSVAGAVSCSGATATFTPSASLEANTVYSATITTGAKDNGGNALASNFNWTFTTAALVDNTVPTVLTVVPVTNAASVAVDTKISVTFSEAMNSSTITSSTFGVKQGTTSVSGSVTYSAGTATFTPSAKLAGGTKYTVTVTTGVKDASGNSMAADYSWSFTTASVSTAVSFANDVIPVLTKCNACHNHPWTTSTDPSTYYNNLVAGNYVNAASPTTSKIYIKLNAGHGSSVPSADINKILTWMSEGSKNN